MASTCKSCIVVHPLHSLGRHPSQKSFLLPHTDTRPRRDYSSQYAGARADTRAEERSRHACVHTGRDIPISFPLGHRNPPPRAGETGREGRVLSKLAPLGQTVISIPKESQRFSASCAGVGKEGCDERREEREEEREKKRNGKIVKRWNDRLCGFRLFGDRFELGGYSMTLKETQWFSKGNFIEIGKGGCGGKRR